MTLVDDQRKETRCQVRDIITYQNADYYVMHPIWENGNENDILILKDEGEVMGRKSYFVVEDEDELFALKHIISARLENRIVTLFDVEDNAEEFEVVEMITYDGKNFVILNPLDPLDEDDGLFPLQVEKTEAGEGRYLPVEDETTFQEIFRIFLEKDDVEFLN